MPDDAVRSASPVNGPAGFGGRTPNRQPPRPAPDSPPPRAADRVCVEHATSLARRLLRQRVLARTRVGLELDETHFGPEFAEVLEEESLSAFLGRLLSAQNQLAAHRSGVWTGARLRRCLDEALHSGAEETLELLAADRRDDSQAIGLVGEVLAEYGRRLAALAAEPERG